MKRSNHGQLYAEPKNILSVNSFSSKEDNRPFNLSGSDGTDMPVQLPILANSFSGNKVVAEMVKPGRTIFRAFKAETAGSKSPLIRIKSHKAAPRQYFDTYLKEIAARLSDIEMALDCYDLSGIQFSAHVLKDLFHDLRLPAIHRLTVHVEVMARDNQLEEVKDLFREIKKAIGSEVQRRNQR